VSTARQIEKGPGKSRVATVVSTIDELVGAHERALEAIFMRNAPADPEALGETPRGLLLTFAGTSQVHLAAREAIRLLSRGGAALWQGIHFDHGGNGGSHRFFGKSLVRFHAEHAASKLDAAPALVLSYAKAGFPWGRLQGELRTVGKGLAMGPVFFGGTVVAWVAFAASPRG